METFGIRLKKARTARGISQARLANSLGLNESTISGYENCKYFPDFMSLKAICEELKVSADELIWGYNPTSKYIPTALRDIDVTDIECDFLYHPLRQGELA